jgi:hypothetical protein
MPEVITHIHAQDYLKRIYELNRIAAAQPAQTILRVSSRSRLHLLQA